jgi:hypothetical protein
VDFCHHTREGAPGSRIKGFGRWGPALVSLGKPRAIPVAFLRGFVFHLAVERERLEIWGDRGVAGTGAVGELGGGPAWVAIKTGGDG